MIIAKSFLRQFLGLMFQPPKDILFVLNKEKRVTLHMLFVFYPIYILFYNQNKELISFKRCYPFQPFILSPRCKYILETRNKTFLKQNKIKNLWKV